MHCKQKEFWMRICIKIKDSSYAVITKPGATQIWKGDPRTPEPPCIMVLSAMVLQSGVLVFRLLLTTHGETNACKMFPWSSHTMWHFTFMLILQYMHMTDQGYFGLGPAYPQLEPHAAVRWDKDGAGSVILGLYLWRALNFHFGLGVQPNRGACELTTAEFGSLVNWIL